MHRPQVLCCVAASISCRAGSLARDDQEWLSSLERTQKGLAARAPLIGNPCVKPLRKRRSHNPFGTANPALAAPAPSGWSAQKALAHLFPTVSELRRAIEPEIR